MSDLEKLYQEYVSALEEIASQVHKNVDGDLIELHKKAEAIDTKLKELENKVEAWQKRKLEARYEELTFRQSIRHLPKRDQQQLIQERLQNLQQQVKLEEDVREEDIELDDEDHLETNPESVYTGDSTEEAVEDLLEASKGRPSKDYKAQQTVRDKDIDLTTKAVTELHALSDIVSKKRRDSFVWRK